MSSKVLFRGKLMMENTLVRKSESAWWCRPVIPAAPKLRQETRKFKDSLETEIEKKKKGKKKTGDLVHQQSACLASTGPSGSIPTPERRKRKEGEEENRDLKAII